MPRINFGYYVTFAILAAFFVVLGNHLYGHNLLAAIHPYEYTDDPLEIKQEAIGRYKLETSVYYFEADIDYQIYIAVFGGELDQCAINYSSQETVLGTFKQGSGANFSLFNADALDYSFIPPFRLEQAGNVTINNLIKMENENYDLRIYQNLPSIYLRDSLLIFILSALGIGFWTIAYFKYQVVIEKFNSIPID